MIKFHQLAQLPPLSPRLEVVEGILAKGEVLLLTGPPGSGKSAVAVFLASCITNGSEFLGRNTLQGNIAYLAAERRLSIQRRLTVSDCDNTRVWLAGGVFSIVEDHQKFIDSLKQDVSKPDVIFVDTLARVSSGMDENSAKDMGRVMAAISQVSDAFPDAAIVIIHHTTKNGGTARGSSAILAAADIELRARGGRNGMSLKIEKANEVEEGQVLYFDLRAVNDGNNNNVVQAFPIDNSNTGAIRNCENNRRAQEGVERAARVVDLMPINRTINRSEINVLMEHAGIFDNCEMNSRPSVGKRILDRMLENGLITNNRNGYSVAKTNIKHTKSD